MKLFCLAHAGGSARTLARALAPHTGELAVAPLERPGRGSRWREPAVAGWSELVHDLTEQIRDGLDGPRYGLLGHSFGALIAYELGQWLPHVGLPPPRLVVAAGRHPPHLRPVDAPWRSADLSDEELLDTLRKLGGVPARAAGPLTYQGYLPAVRADLRLAASYAPAGRDRLDCPLLVLYGRSDPLTSAALLLQWRDYSRQWCELRAVGGGHFFLATNAAEAGQVVRRIGRRLDRSGVPEGGRP